MKTNQVMKSSDRVVFGITVRQETKNGFMSVTDLQQAYEKARWMHGWGERHINTILQVENTRLKVYHLLHERGLIKVGIPTFTELVDNQGIVNYLKNLGVWKTTGRGTNRNVVCDPYIWTLLAMELNPMLYAKVIIWLTDSLIFDRMDAGDKFKPMNGAISRLLPKPDYPTYAREINLRVFGEHITGMRNLASAKELRLISEIENTVTKAIEHEWVKTEEEILKLIRTY
jgi:hypothetical protein